MDRRHIILSLRESLGPRRHVFPTRSADGYSDSRKRLYQIHKYTVFSLVLVFLCCRHDNPHSAGHRFDTWTTQTSSGDPQTNPGLRKLFFPELIQSIQECGQQPCTAAVHVDACHGHTLHRYFSPRGLLEIKVSRGITSGRSSRIPGTSVYPHQLADISKMHARLPTNTNVRTP